MTTSWYQVRSGQGFMIPRLAVPVDLLAALDDPNDREGDETPCPAREDRLHCVHWYDGEPCCSCGDA